MTDEPLNARVKTGEPIIFTDRYQALGIPYPDLKTACRGQCEGIGVYPLWLGRASLDGMYEREIKVTAEEAQRWHQLHEKAHTLWSRIRKVRYEGLKALWRQCDGYHFITCPDCNGNGEARVKLGDLMLRALQILKQAGSAGMPTGLIGQRCMEGISEKCYRQPQAYARLAGKILKPLRKSGHVERFIDGPAYFWRITWKGKEFLAR